MNSGRARLKAVFVSIFFVMVLSMAAQPVVAQSFRYMDAAGNIIFVDRLEQVPQRYRNQLAGIAPTPIIVKDVKAQKRLEMEKAREAKIKERERKQREKQANKKPKTVKRVVSQEEADRIAAMNAYRASQAAAAATATAQQSIVPEQETQAAAEPASGIETSGADTHNGINEDPQAELAAQSESQ